MAQINKPSDYFNTVTWTGNGSKITTGLRPDLIWYKARDVSGYGGVVNAISGNDYYVQTYSSDAETNSAGLLVSDSTGFTPGSVFSTNSYVSWNWLAGGTASSNTDGSITSSVSANTTAGFSIVSYTGNGSAGATVGHGLGATPAMFLIKRRDVADGWIVYHHKNTSAPETDHLRLDNTSATSDDNTKFNDTAPTSSVFSLGSDTSVNGSSSTFIAYCFAEKKGYSKFGSYTGNGNANGTFVYTGFKPAFVITKKSSNTGNWLMYDNKRDSDNVVNATLNPNLNNAESSVDTMDFVSNGFKLRRSLDPNTSATTYIYMAFAEQPLVGTNNIPATAR